MWYNYKNIHAIFPIQRNYTNYPLTNGKTQLQKLILLSFLCHFTPSVSILCMYSIKLEVNSFIF